MLKIQVVRQIHTFLDDVLVPGQLMLKAFNEPSGHPVSYQYREVHG